KNCRLNDPYGSFKSKAPNWKAMEEAMYLIPSTVDRNGLSIGCFEVTRSQYKVFDLKFAFAPSTANFPANNVTLENAEAYAKWLGKLTGQTWRLPYEDELKELYENREVENTLDYWAGYAPNPEDMAKLHAKAKQLGGTAPLLKEVGSFA